jgi:hypothetical protein
MAVASGDTNPPSASITAPAAGATVSGTVTLSANASDDVGVTGVQFTLDGANVGAEDKTSPYAVPWDTTTAGNGSHTLRAVARDAAGNTRTSSAVSLTVANDTSPPLPTILWSADHEEGNMSDWYTPSGGGEFNSGGGVSAASTDVAHTGRYSAKATISTPPSPSAVRLFRWAESRANPEAYYSAWFYFPRIYTPSWWIIDQFKSRECSTCDPDPFWFVQAGNRLNGTMFLYLTWWYGPWPNGTVEGPHEGEFGGRDYYQTIKDLPTNQWVHVEIFLRQSSAFDGEIAVWQDGVEILRQSNVKTRYPYMGDEWAPSSYSGSILPSPATIYIDDAAISLTRLGPNPPSSCRTSGASWQNQAFPVQGGTFTAQFDVTPGAANVDGVTGLAAGNAAAYTDLAAIVRFNSAGTIDTRNGDAYSALTSIPYVAGTTYRVRMVVDVPAHTYSAYVTPPGGSEQTLGLDYAFRSEQATANTLSALASFTNGGTLQICNFAVTTP